MVTYDDVRAILDESVADRAMTALHGKFWQRLDRDEFVRHRVAWFGVEIPLLKIGDADGSSLIAFLAMDNHMRMPYARPAIPPDKIEKIKDWINGGCP